MTVRLNHTIVYSRDRAVSAQFMADVLGLQALFPFGPFLCVQTANDVTLDFIDTLEEITEQHYAFLVSEEEFDVIFGRIKDRGLTYWADPFHLQTGKINTNDGGRGVYFDDPDGHALEILTRPYGSGS